MHTARRREPFSAPAGSCSRGSEESLLRTEQMVPPGRTRGVPQRQQHARYAQAGPWLHSLGNSRRHIRASRLRCVFTSPIASSACSRWRIAVPDPAEHSSSR